MLENWAKLSGFAAILAAVLSVSFLWALNYVPPQNVDWTCEGNYNSEDPNSPTLKSFSCHTKQPENLNSQTKRTETQGDKNVSDSIKITDVFLAVFNGLLVIVTAILIAVGIGQGRELKRAVDASRDDFFATHRPKVRIKHLWLASDIWQGEAIRVNLTLVNNGTAEGIFNEAGLRFFVVKADRPLPPEPNIPVILRGPGKMLCGLNLYFREIDTNTVLTQQENVDVQNARSKLYCIGYVSYLDGKNRMRITGFCRVLTFPTNVLALASNCRFRALDPADPDFEYED
jgi:hypothetical protein